jgi:hypothetical protein
VPPPKSFENNDMFASFAWVRIEPQAPRVKAKPSAITPYSKNKTPPIQETEGVKRLIAIEFY